MSYLDELDDIVYENRMKDIRADSRARPIGGVEAGRISPATLEGWEMRNGLRPCPHRNVDILVKRLDGSGHVQCWVCMAKYAVSAEALDQLYDEGV